MAKKRKRKLQNGGRVLTAQEKIAQQILSGQRPAQRQSAARRKGRTTSELPSDEVRDRASNVLPDPRVFERAYAKYQAGENLSRQDKIDLGIEGAFGAAALIPGIGFVAQKGKPMIKGLTKKLLGSAPQGSKAKKTKAEKIAAENKAAREAAEKKKRSPQKSKTPDYESPPVSKPQKPRTVVDDSTGKAVPYKPSKDPANKKPPSKPRTSAANIGRVARGEQPRQSGQFRKPTGVEKVVGGAGRKIRENPGKAAAAAAGAAGVGVGAGGMKLYDSIEKRPNNKNVNTTKANKNKAPFVEGYNMDMDDFDSPKPSYPKPPKTSKPSKAAKAADDGYKFYGKEGTGLGDFSRKYDIKYATQEQFDKDFGMDDGEKRGGRPGKSKMKTQGLNRSKRSGFSGRGTGAALRGF